MLKRLFAAIAALSIGACVQTENSNSLDKDVFSGAGGTPEFVAARQVLINSCQNCHSFHTQTEDELVASGLVVGGDPDNSPIYYRLVGSTGGQGPKDMPTGGSLSNGDRALVRAWVQSVP